jgi:hypothetical protein
MVELAYKEDEDGVEARSGFGLNSEGKAMNMEQRNE